MTALTIYITNAAAPISTDNLLVTSSGGGTTNKNTTVGKNTGYGFLDPQGSGSFAASSTIPDPNDTGWLWNDTTLADNNASFSPGTWTSTMTLQTNASSVTADLYTRVYRRASNGTFYPIVTMHSGGQTINTTETHYTVSGTTTSASDSFQTGDQLFMDQLVRITVNTTNSNTTVIKTYVSNSSTLGNTNGQVVTPGYITVTPVSDDSILRFRLRSSNQLYNIPMRLRTIAAASSIIRSFPLRLKASKSQTRDIASRFRLQTASISQNDLAMRFLTRQPTSQDAMLRFKLSPYAHTALFPTPQRRTGQFPTPTRRQSV